MALYFSHPFVSVGHIEESSFYPFTCNKAVWVSPLTHSLWWQWVQQQGANVIIQAGKQDSASWWPTLARKVWMGPRGIGELPLHQSDTRQYESKPTSAGVVSVSPAGGWTNIPIWLSCYTSTGGVPALKKKKKKDETGSRASQYKLKITRIQWKITHHARTRKIITLTRKDKQQTQHWDKSNAGIILQGL